MIINLANKYRPSTWDDVCEQSIVTKMLRNICESDIINNRNFLLIGSQGVGKTSIARVMAHSLNGNTVEPIEVDGASNNGIDSIRELIQQAHQYPVGCNWKVIVVDECHALTSNSWQALLRTLEENPAKTIWIFCTTNPEKIPDTILSRLQVFHLSKISLNGIFNRLKYVLDSEIAEGRDIKYSDDALLYIAKLAKGGMRDALTLTDKVLSFSENIDINAVELALNLPDFDTYFALLSAYAKKDNDKIIQIIEKAYNSGLNFVTWLEKFHSFIVDVLKYIFTKDIQLTLIPPQYESKLSKYETAHANICLQLAGILLSCIRDIRTTDYQTEIAYTYLCRR